MDNFFENLLMLDKRDISLWFPTWSFDPFLWIGTTTNNFSGKMQQPAYPSYNVMHKALYLSMDVPNINYVIPEARLIDDSLMRLSGR